MRNYTDIFIDSILERCQNIPDNVSKRAVDLYLDYIGVTLAGSRMISEKAKTYLESVSTISKNGCTVLGFATKCSYKEAAFINGLSAHVTELDDGHRVGMLHLGAPIFSAMTAIAEYEHLATKDFIYGTIVAYESAIRLASAIQPGHKLKGFHATGTCGIIGVAMGVATALQLSKSQVKSAFAAAITSASGVLEMIEGDSELKPYNVGRAAMDGITAAYFGKSGFKSPENPLGGDRGFLSVMTDKVNYDLLFPSINNPFCIETTYQKPYAACRHCHAPIEAVLLLNEKHHLSTNQIETILVKTYKLAVGGHDHTIIDGMNSSKMSIPYSVAVALFNGHADIDDFSFDAISNSEVLSLAQKIKVVEDESLTVLCPQKRAAIVEIHLNDGTIITERVDYPKGEPENPMSKAEMIRKFRSLASYGGVSEGMIEEIIHELARMREN